MQPESGCRILNAEIKRSTNKEQGPRVVNGRVAGSHLIPVAHGLFEALPWPQWACVAGAMKTFCHALTTFFRKGCIAFDGLISSGDRQVLQLPAMKKILTREVESPWSC